MVTVSGASARTPVIVGMAGCHLTPFVSALAVKRCPV
jgi:hypothetical protein